MTKLLDKCTPKEILGHEAKVCITEHRKKLRPSQMSCSKLGAWSQCPSRAIYATISLRAQGFLVSPNASIKKRSGTQPYATTPTPKRGREAVMIQLVLHSGPRSGANSSASPHAPRISWAIIDPRLRLQRGYD